MYTRILKILLLLPLLACEKEVDFEIPDPGPKITIDARLQAGEPVQALVSQSVHALDSADPDRSDIFQVLLYEDGQFVDTLAYQEGGPVGELNYRSPYVAREGRRYELRASSPELPDARGMDGVPTSVNILDWSYDEELQDLRLRLPGFNGDYGGYYQIELNYQATGSRGQSSGNHLISSLDPEIEFFDSAFEPSNPNRPSGLVATVDARMSGGADFEVTLRTSINPLTDAGLPDADSVFFILNCQHITEEHYRFSKRQAATGIGDDFFGEPVQLYFNVEGGYGIVMGSAVNEEKLILKP